MCVIDIFSKCLDISLKDKKGVSIVDAFQKILDKSGRKLSKIMVIKEVHFTIILLRKWLKDNDVEIYSIHNEGKSAVAERFIRTLRTKSINT